MRYDDEILNSMQNECFEAEFGFICFVFPCLGSGGWDEEVASVTLDTKQVV